MRGLDVAVGIVPARGDGCVPPTPGSNVKRRSDSDSYSVTTDPLATARTVVTLHRVARQSRVSPFSVRYRTDGLQPHALKSMLGRVHASNTAFSRTHL